MEKNRDLFLQILDQRGLHLRVLVGKDPSKGIIRWFETTTWAKAYICM